MHTFAQVGLQSLSPKPLPSTPIHRAEEVQLVWLSLCSVCCADLQVAGEESGLAGLEHQGEVPDHFLLELGFELGLKLCVLLWVAAGVPHRFGHRSKVSAGTMFQGSVFRVLVRFEGTRPDAELF